MLRPYQQTLVREWEQDPGQPTLIQLPTGGGKTVIFSTIIQAAANRGQRCLVLVHRRELVRQAQATLLKAGVFAATVVSGIRTPWRCPVLVGMVQTVSRRLTQMAAAGWQPDLIIIDEAHHAVAGSWQRVLTTWPQASRLGVTATPERLDGRGMGDLFARLLCGPQTAALIEAGHLAPVRMFSHQLPLRKLRVRAGDFAMEGASVDLGSVNALERMVEGYRRHCDGQRAVAFCCTVKHAEALARRLVHHGIRAKAIDGATPDRERAAALRDLGTGTLHVLTNCQLFGEGLDVPAIESVMIARPTQSLAWWLQMVGRGLRPTANKCCATILDFAGNTERLGHPLAPRVWSLEGRSQRQAAEQAMPKPPDEDKGASGERGMAPTGHERINLEEVQASDHPMDHWLREAKRKRRGVKVALSLAAANALHGGGRLTVADVLHLQQKGGAKPGWVVPAIKELLLSDAVTVTPTDLAMIAKKNGYHPGWAKHQIHLLCQHGGK